MLTCRPAGLDRRFFELKSGWLAMTVAEADAILEIVCTALQDTSHRRRPVSALQGHDLHDIRVALKLRIANERLELAHRTDFEERFADGLRVYGSIPWQIMMSFVPDDQVDNIGAQGAFNSIDAATMTFKDARLAGAETESSFGEYCKSLAPYDPRYWEKVFARIGLDPPKSFWEKARDGRWPFAVWVVLLFSLDMVGTWRVVVLGTTLAVAIALSVLLRNRHRREGRNGTPGWTILAAAAAMFTWSGTTHIIETGNHHGPGIVVYGDGDRYPEREELVEEIEYKQHNYMTGAFMIGAGVLCLYLLRMFWNSDRPQQDSS